MKGAAFENLLASDVTMGCCEIVLASLSIVWGGGNIQVRCFAGGDLKHISSLLVVSIIVNLSSLPRGCISYDPVIPKSIDLRYLVFTAGETGLKLWDKWKLPTRFKELRLYSIL